MFGMAPLSRWLLDKYGWRGTLLIQGGIILNGLVLAALVRPVRDFNDKCDTSQKAGHDALNLKLLLLHLKQSASEIFDFSLLKQPVIKICMISAFYPSAFGCMGYCHGHDGRADKICPGNISALIMWNHSKSVHKLAVVL